MKTISKKQFQNAVATVLNGGSSKFITTYETKPLYWSISKKFKTLQGRVPENSKFSHNEKRGGRESDVYLVCELAFGFEIGKTKAELKLEAKKQAVKNASLKNDRDAKANELKAIASANGFSSVAKLKESQKEIDSFNHARFDRAKAKQLEVYEAEFGTFQAYKIADRWRISHIELVYDCDKKENLI